MAAPLHFFPRPVGPHELPAQFNCPFHYTPHPLCVEASHILQAYLDSRTDWKTELESGKMFGVLVVETDNKEIGFLAAFSGNLAKSNRHEFFVPPVYDLLAPDGFFRAEEQEISAINSRITTLENAPERSALQQRLQDTIRQNQEELSRKRTELRNAKALRDEQRKSADTDAAVLNRLIRESQFQKAEYKRLEQRLQAQEDSVRQQLEDCQNTIETLKQERKRRSAALQQRLFSQFVLLNAQGEASNLWDIFQATPSQTPPAGAGECAAPKLLQYAYSHRMRPICMAEFWWGGSPRQTIRHHGTYYPACQSKCGPILGHMLKGLPADENPFTSPQQPGFEPKTIYEDDQLIIVDKPAGMLSVPGKSGQPSVWQYITDHCPDVSGPLTVHRLDMSTSGILILAKNKQAHQHMQQQFEQRTVRKRYTALLEGVPASENGFIRLSLAPDLEDRPRQRVDFKEGKAAVTRYQTITTGQGTTRVHFWPLTGRTHQLRVHAAHPEGLACPIVGDELYGHKADRLYLHADYVEFRHPTTGQICRIHCPAPF